MSKRWNLYVSEQLDQQLEQYLKQSPFKTKSEFIRTAVRDRLKEEMDKHEKEIQR
jgi:Arc/MetJ-type ribon-helix-helix transcriptional regulator